VSRVNEPVSLPRLLQFLILRTIFLRGVFVLEIGQLRHGSARKSNQCAVKTEAFGFWPGCLVVFPHGVERVLQFAGVDAFADPFYVIVVFRMGEQPAANFQAQESRQERCQSKSENELEVRHAFGSFELTRKPGDCRQKKSASLLCGT